MENIYKNINKRVNVITVKQKKYAVLLYTVNWYKINKKNGY